MTKLLLAGATGLVGSHALALALADDRVTRIVAPTRRSLPLHPKLLNPIVDTDRLPGDAEWWHVDGAICALGTTRARAGSAAAFRAIDLDYALAIATQVRNRGATRFALTSATGADARSRFLYMRTKGELEHAVEALGFASLTIVRPGLLAGHRHEIRLAEQIGSMILRAIAPILPAGARVSPAATVASFLVEAAIGGVTGTRFVSPKDIAVAAARTTA